MSFIQTSILSQALRRRLAHLGLATPLSYARGVGPVALRPHLSMSMPM